MLGVAADAMPGGGISATTTVEVWDDHWTAFCIFRASGTQWRVLATQTAVLYLGLDYPGVDLVMRRLLPSTADLGPMFADVMAMEAEALIVLNGDGA